MIYTITINPAIDYLMTFKNDINRHQSTQKVKYLIGGKGINASILLNNLNINNKAIVVVGGYNGKKFVEIAKHQKINLHKIKVPQELRINVKANFQNKTYEQNFSGEKVDATFINNQILKALSNLSAQDSVLFMGSCPPGYTIKNIEEIIKFITKKQAKFILDIPIANIESLFKYKPELIKPNLKELENIFQTTITHQTIYQYANKLLKLGVQKIIVSLDQKGALYFDSNNAFIIKVPQIQEKNGAGAGDAMIAAFKYALILNLPIKEALIISTAAAVATATSETIATYKQIDYYKQFIKIKGGDG